MRKRKWLVCCSYNPHKDNISNHLQLIRKKLDLYSSSYERIILVGDFSSEINDKCMNDFCESYNLSSLIRESTCYKNPENPSRIDLFLMNSPNSFQNSGVVETGLSDFHRMIVTVMKTSFQRLPPKIRHYRDYSNYGNNTFHVSLFNELSNLSIEAIDLNKYVTVCIDTLNNHAPSKKKYIRGNDLPFMNKELSKEIMHRTRLWNNFLRNRSDENKRKYSKQRNYCVSLLRKTKKTYGSNLNEKKITDSKTFWRTVKRFLSDKTSSDKKINLIKKDKIIKTGTKTTNVLYAFFSKIISNLNVPKNPVSDPISNDINNPVLKSILKYKDHRSIKAFEKISKLNSLFKFCNVEKGEILNEIVNLDAWKSCQDTDVPTKIIKENADIFADFIHPAINASINKNEFPSFLKLADVVPVFNKGSKNSKHD